MDIPKAYGEPELIAAGPAEWHEIKRLLGEVASVFERDGTDPGLRCAVAINLMANVMRRPEDTPAAAAEECARLFQAIAKRMAS
jgi:hypothetical protein